MWIHAGGAAVGQVERKFSRIDRGREREREHIEILLPLHTRAAGAARVRSRQRIRRRERTIVSVIVVHAGRPWRSARHHRQQAGERVGRLRRARVDIRACSAAQLREVRGRVVRDVSLEVDLVKPVDAEQQHARGRRVVAFAVPVVDVILGAVRDEGDSQSDGRSGRETYADDPTVHEASMRRNETLERKSLETRRPCAFRAAPDAGRRIAPSTARTAAVPRSRRAALPFPSGRRRRDRSSGSSPA